jgi:hypothetical protein
VKDSSFTLAFFVLAALWAASVPAPGATEILYWDTKPAVRATCIYGQIMVLATVPKIYYCTTEWYGVGGYCGIQDISPTERRAIFSIWDPSPALHGQVIEADPQAIYSRFNEFGNVAGSHIIFNWKVEKPVQFFVQKLPGKKPATTETRFYVFDDEQKAWRPVSGISDPNPTPQQGPIFDNPVSWIENIGGQADPAVVKMALYDLWAGSSPDTLRRLTVAGGGSGSGRWGQLSGSYFLAEGSPENLAAFFAAHEQAYGKPLFGVDGHNLPPLQPQPLPARLVETLKNLPRAPAASPQ